MAAKIDLSSVFFQEKVSDKPPVPIRPVSGKFHNRGKLFPSTCHNKFFECCNGNEIQVLDKSAVENKCRELELHHSALKDDSDFNETKIKKIPNYCKRTQSAKARQRTKPLLPVTRRTRPQSAGVLGRQKGQEKHIYAGRIDDEKNENKQVAVIDLANNITPDLLNIQKEQLLALPDPRNYNCNANNNNIRPMTFASFSPASYSHEHSEKCACRSSVLSREIEQRLKPSIYGLYRQRHVYGSNQDLTSDSLDCFPYKVDHNLNNRIAHHRGKEELDDRICNLPETLEPLCPWLSESVPQEVIGVDPSKCLVFLPSMEYSSLPEVPEPHSGEDDLPFLQDVTTPKPWNPKKYPHPFNKKPVEEWVCKHNSHMATEEEKLKWITLYKNLKMPRMRTADVIKKEITDLENLLKGVGTQQSDCAMVRYQDDLTTLQDMLQITLDKIPERLKIPAPDSPDRFGLNKVFKDHDSVIQEIQSRVEECRLELAELELEAGIETERQYFRKRSNSTL